MKIIKVELYYACDDDVDAKQLAIRVVGDDPHRLNDPQRFGGNSIRYSGCSWEEKCICHRHQKGSTL